MQETIDVLLIEDNLQEAQLTIRSLQKINLGNRLLHLDDGNEALDFLFSKNKYASRPIKNDLKLILLDLKLPKVDGLEILRAIKANNNTKMIPVAILTSSKQQTDVIESYKLGVNSYIVKPVNFDSFSKAVTELGLYWLLTNVTAVDV